MFAKEARSTSHAKRNPESQILKRFIVSAAISAISLFITLSTWTLSSPLGSSPDEDFHIGSIWCADGFATETCKAVSFWEGSGYQVVSVPHVIDTCFRFDAKKSADCKGDAKSKAPLLRANDNFAYPPVFYEFMNTFVDKRTQVSGISMRLVNSLIASILLFFAIILSSSRTRNSMLIGFISTLVPLGMFLIPSLNPSGWSYISLAFSWIFLTNAINSHQTSKSIRNTNWILYFCCLVMAFGSRWDSGAYILVSTGAVIALNGLFGNFFKKLNDLNQRSKLIVTATFATVLLTITYFFISRISAIAHDGIFPAAESTSSWEPKSLFLYNLVHLIELPAGTFGYASWGLGWFDTPLPSIVAFIGTAVYLFFLLQSLPFSQFRNYIVVFALFVFTALVLMFALTSSGIPVGETVQPRYVLPMMPVILGIAVWSSKTMNPFGADPRARAIAIGALISLAHAVSLWTNIRRYTSGLTKNQDYNLNNPLEWWWEWAPSPNFVFVLGVCSFSLFIYSSFRLILMRSESKTELAVSRRV